MREQIKNIIQEELERVERSKEYEKINNLFTKKYGKEWWGDHRLRNDIEAILGDQSEIEDIASYYYMDKAITIWKKTRNPQKVANAVQYAYTHAQDTYQSVRKFLIDKGFGFIRDEGGVEHFFHRSAVRGAVFELLREGQRVDFTIEESTKGPRAGEVRLIES